MENQQSSSIEQQAQKDENPFLKDQEKEDGSMLKNDSMTFSPDEQINNLFLDQQDFNPYSEEHNLPNQKKKKSFPHKILHSP